jgi:hypothetical protein
MLLLLHTWVRVCGVDLLRTKWPSCWTTGLSMPRANEQILLALNHQWTVTCLMLWSQSNLLDRVQFYSNLFTTMINSECSLKTLAECRACSLWFRWCHVGCKWQSSCGLVSEMLLEGHICINFCIARCLWYGIFPFGVIFERTCMKWISETCVTRFSLL